MSVQWEVTAPVLTVLAQKSLHLDVWFAHAVPAEGTQSKCIILSLYFQAKIACDKGNSLGFLQCTSRAVVPSSLAPDQQQQKQQNSPVLNPADSGWAEAGYLYFDASQVIPRHPRF